MARTKTPTPEAPAPPAPPPDETTQDLVRPSPVLAWPSEWPVPELPAAKQRRARGLPMAPVLAGSGNATALTTTAAYSAGGPYAAAATGVVIAAGVTVAALRRRAAVERSVAARAGGGTSSAQLRGSSGRVAAGAGGGSGLRRSGPGGRGGRATRSGGGSGGAAMRSGSGSLLGRSGGGRHRRRNNRDRSGLSPQTRSGRRDRSPRERNREREGANRNPGAIRRGAQTVRAAAARAARATANAARTHGARTTRTLGRGIRHATAAARDGLAALLAGAWTALRRGGRAGLDRLRTVWRRRRNRRNQPATPADPAVADTVRRPTSSRPASANGGTRMSGGGHHFVAPAMEAARAAANYQPTGMLQVGADFAGLEEALRLHAEAMKVTVENADAHQPLHPNIVELMRQIHALQLKAAELATELQPAFQSLHDVDIARLENPRKGVAGERMWDVSANL